MKIINTTIMLDTGAGFSVHDISAAIRSAIADAGISDGFVTVVSHHTTTALGINEYEERLLDDMKTFFAQLVPPDKPYQHNDIHLRDCPPDEPENAHAHLVALLLGRSESIPLRQGELVLGQYQSLLLFELDGPRSRRVEVQICGQ